MSIVPPGYIMIPIPERVPIDGGIMSLYSHGSNIVFRMHDNDIELVQLEADALGISRSALIRWATLNVVKQLHRRRTGVHKQVRL